MKPIKLIMQAFGPYVDKTVIDFSNLEGRDFFLIHGATGAGKTSILDAICYALYGETSVEDRTGDMLRNQQADLDTPTYVELIFELGNKQYKVRRNPNYDRKKSRGEGLTREKAAAELFVLEADGVEKPLATKAQEVTAQISALIGFRSDQFRQVVLIPQGEFRRLLMASSDEREKIMEILFKTGIFRDIENALKNQAAEISKANDDLNLKMNAVLMDTGAGCLEELVELEKAKSAEIKDASEKTAELKSVFDQVQKKKTEMSALEDLFRQQEKAENQLNFYQAKREEISQREKQLDIAKKLNSLMDVKNQAVSAEKRLSEKDRTLKEAGIALEESCAELEKAKDIREKDLGLQPARDKAKSLIERLKGFEDSEKELRVAAADYEKNKSAAEKLEGQLKKMQQTQEILQENFKNLSEEESELIDVPAEYARKKAECDALARPKSRLLEVENNFSGLRGAAFAYTSDEKKVSACTMQVQTAERNKNQKVALQLAGYAAHLACNLQDGAPCPVCGSTEHPHLAISEEIIPTKEEIAQAEKHIEQCRNWLQSSEDVRDKSKNKWISTRSGTAGAFRELARELEEAGYTEKIPVLDEALAPEAAMSEIEKIKEGLKPVHKWLDEKIQLAKTSALELSRQEKRLGLVKSEKEKSSKQTDVISKDIAQLMSSLEAVKNELAVALGKLEEKKKNLPEKYREAHALKNELFLAEKESRRLEKEHLKAEEAFAKASKAHSSAEAGYKALQDALKEAQEQAENARRTYVERIKSAGFVDEEAIRSAEESMPREILSEAGLRAAEKHIQEYHSGLNALTIRLSELKESLSGKKRPDMESLEAELSNAEVCWKQASEALAGFKAQEKIFAGKVRNLQELENSYAELLEKHRTLGFLADIATGKNNSRMTFQTYVLRALLRDVVDAANLRLIKMSRGQYQLQPAKGVRDQRKQSGLDLVIYDDFTGSQRPMATLSGGESFLASLSLALGLADVVKSYSGGIRLDTIFIDEGFGTLDGETLDMAIKTLSELRQNGRLVGIISHVEELKSQIPVRLEITKGRHGSHARFSIDD